MSRVATAALFVAAAVMIAVQIINTETRRNPSGERGRAVSAGTWESLPFQWALTSKRGDGRRKIAIFSDPNCPFCKRLEGELAKLDDITVHIFLYPIIAPESVRQTKSVWCSKDRAGAWENLTHRGIEPTAPADCETPIEQLLELGSRLGARSTPTWFLENGESYTGAKPLEKLRRLLDAASPRR